VLPTADCQRLSAGSARIHGPWLAFDHEQAEASLNRVLMQMIGWLMIALFVWLFEGREHHPIAASFRRLERAERRSQADIDREHAANPDDGAECVKGEGEGGHEEGSRFEALQRLHAGLCEPWQAAAQSAGSPHLSPLTFPAYVSLTITFAAFTSLSFDGTDRAGIPPRSRRVYSPRAGDGSSLWQRRRRNSMRRIA